MNDPLVINRSLREQVYDHLKWRMNAGVLVPGAFLDLNAIAAEIGISRTPLRDALLHLESEGFVEILPRRGVQVVELSLEKIRDIYELLGALESAALRGGARRLTPEVVRRMEERNAAMREALAAGDFESFYARNLEFHDSYLDLSENDELRRMVTIQKQRLYDFPRKRAFVKEWEFASTEEHARLVELLGAGEVGAAADFLRDVHWSFEVQEPFIRKYYLDRERAPASGGVR